MNLVLVLNSDPSLFLSAGCIASPAHDSYIQRCRKGRGLGSRLTWFKQGRTDWSSNSIAHFNEHSMAYISCIVCGIAILNSLITLLIMIRNPWCHNVKRFWWLRFPHSYNRATNMMSCGYAQLIPTQQNFQTWMRCLHMSASMAHGQIHWAYSSAW